MIKAAGTRQGGGQFVAFGLSDENWARLRAGKPILVNLREMHPELPELSVMLLGGDTEDSLAEDFRAMGWTKP